MKKIAIIGGGPFGLIALNTLVKKAVALNEEVTILIFDPHGPGGKVWRSNQSSEVIMNTVMQHVTLFSEDEGPNLGEWSQNEAIDFLASLNLLAEEEFLFETSLAKNDYCSRRYYGIYQRWFFSEILKKIPESVTVHFMKEKIIDLTVVADKIILTGEKTYSVSDVILATGHASNQDSKEEKKNRTFAKANKLFYQGPANPVDVPLENLVQGAIIIRGVGLSFYDYLSLLVNKWGGKFIEKEGEIIYQPSGREEKVIVGSGRGVPYRARPINQKLPGEEAQPQILTKKFMTQFQGSVTEIVDRLKKEAELVYYKIALRNSNVDMVKFLFDYQKQDTNTLLKKYCIPKHYKLDWDKLLNPAQDIPATDFSEFIFNYLQEDIKQAELGNKRGAIAAAIDTFKELQAPFNYMLDHEKFAPKEYYQDFWGDFNRSYSFLAIGAPVIRQKQLAAFYKAGFVDFLAPEMVVEQKNGEFIAYSKKDKKRCFKGKNLIEARLPKTDLAKTKNPLINKMRDKGYLAPHIVIFEGEKHETGALLVHRQTHQIIDSKGKLQPHIFCYGIPLEGLDWLNAASPRPKSHDRVFYLANQIIETIYEKKQ